MIIEDKPFLLFASCIPVKGAKKAIICDLQKQEYSFIPTTLYHLLEKYHGNTILSIKKDYPNQIEVINEYFSFLTNEKYIFFTDTPELFPKLSMVWQEPTEITNAIIDFDNQSKFEIQDIIDQLIELHCKHIQIRVFCEKNISFYKTLISKYKTAKVFSIELIIKYHDSISMKKLIDMISENETCISVVVHSATRRMKKHNISFIEETITSKEHCGIISPNFFVINIKSFTEAKSYNSCLNGKISIDSDGAIKNCPSLETTYGYIYDTKLKEVITLNTFKEIAKINKDQIEICMDCEFRYICSDCRAYIQDKSNQHSKPLKCNYNPYKGVWE